MPRYPVALDARFLFHALSKLEAHREAGGEPPAEYANGLMTWYQALRARQSDASDMDACRAVMQLTSSGRVHVHLDHIAQALLDAGNYGAAGLDQALETHGARMDAQQHAIYIAPLSEVADEHSVFAHVELAHQKLERVLRSIEQGNHHIETIERATRLIRPRPKRERS